ncbi:lytic murein transglycosylase B [Halothiobacillus sp. 15-55-196]|uniref:lytic murein transglycosylase B n=1 Tax=Halothiobacillus sp. 15-55-196 TaxID=1970382 RepID=UPI0025B98B7D|nr:lytic murein transglycosylase B [Halothiobacillus sp. 15-55-196]
MLKNSKMKHSVWSGKCLGVLLSAFTLGVSAVCLPALADDEAAKPPGNYAARADVREFAREAAQKTGLPQTEIQQWLDAAKYQQSIVDAMNRPAESKTWAQYRPIFITPKRIAAGVAFWNDHAAELATISKKYRVSPAIIVAIVGVETFYGQRMGNYRVIDALATLGFDYPKRGAFFRGQLADFFTLAAKEHIDLNTALGSYAGAMGMPQFIPSSYLELAVDGDGDGRCDLWHSDADVFASVANYFSEHGWNPGGPVGFPIDIDKQRAAAVADKLNTGRDLNPKITIGELRSLGVALPEDLYLPKDEKVMLFTLTGPDKVEYWVGLDNFYVITRYNHSTLYAMAVWQLSQAVEAARDELAAVESLPVKAAQTQAPTP